MDREQNIGLAFTETREYCGQAPYDPPSKYPEYPGEGLDAGNPIYESVRSLLYHAGLDKDQYGKPQWNPLGDIIQPGMKVFIKPNTVMHYHLKGKDLLSVINHASIMRPILDYVMLALKGEGSIVIGDSQIIDGQFDKAMERSGIGQLVEWNRKKTTIPIECFDLRTVRGVRTCMYGRWGRKKVEQDPRGYRTVDLGDDSYFRDIDPRRLRVAIASHKKMYRYHSGGRHEYVFPQSFLESDAVISLSKLKTHRRTAVTMALKNYMGIPADKSCLPHFITGTPQEGGDQYIHPSKRKEICLWLHDQIQSSPVLPWKFVCAVIKKLVWNSSRIVPFKDDIYEAMWPGNDTIWRTLLDLNRIITYADREGKLHDTPQRKQFFLIDGIIGGEGDGPLSPEPVHSGVLVGGFNACCIDAAAATLMGFDIQKIPLIMNGLKDKDRRRPLCRTEIDAIRVQDGRGEMNFEELKSKYNLHYAAHPNWVGKVELPPRESKIEDRVA